jgi:ParB-like chromosome segregation protein Spo0J
LPTTAADRYSSAAAGLYQHDGHALADLGIYIARCLDILAAKAREFTGKPYSRWSSIRWLAEARRSVNEAVVKRLAESIDEVGLCEPITVLDRKNLHSKYKLVAGLHRLEAHKLLGRPGIDAVITNMTKRKARLWELSENLHRSELTVLERDAALAEWISLTDQTAQSGPIESKRSDGKGHRPESGINAAARELGITRQDAQRAVQVASLSDEAKTAARETGLDDNRSVLLEAAKVEPARQAAVIREIAKEKAEPTRTKLDGDVKARAAQGVASKIAKYVPAGEWDMSKADLYAAGASDIAQELAEIIVDRSAGKAAEC